VKGDSYSAVTLRKRGAVNVGVIPNSKPVGPRIVAGIIELLRFLDSFQRSSW
jgi:hypothetical protein